VLRCVARAANTVTHRSKHPTHVGAVDSCADSSRFFPKLSPDTKMPKQNRKRRHENVSKDVEYEVVAPKNKFRPFDEEAQAEEELLNKILFGGSSSFLKSLEEAEQEVGASCSNVDSGVGEDSEDSETKERSPAWYDEDDDGIEVGHALDAQGRKLPSGGINDRKK
jgi:hypothetical protein